MREQYHIVCVISSSNPSIQRISISMWVFSYSMDSLHHHNYKWDSSHSEWTSYMAIISSTIYLGQMQPPSQEIQGILCLLKPPDQTSNFKKIQIGGCGLFLCWWNLYFHSFWFLMLPFLLMELSCFSRVTMWTKKDDVQSERWWITDICSLSERMHISNIHVQLSFTKKIFS